MANFSGGFDTSPNPNTSAFVVTVETVVTAGTPVNLASQVVADGFSVALRAYRGNGNKIVYVANSSLNTGDATKRSELRSGEIISLYIDNTNLIWIDASANGAKIEVLSEV